MGKKHVVGAMLTLGLLVTALVASGAQASASKPLRPGTVSGGGSKGAAPAPQVPTGTVFFSNLGPGGTFQSGGWCVAGATSACGGRFDEAMPFVASTSGIVTQVDVGLTNALGTNSATVELAADSSGHPGQVLASWSTSGQPSYGSTCCTTTFPVHPTVSVVGGKKYWVIAIAGASDTDDAFMWNYNGTNGSYAYSQNGTSWTGAYGTLGAFDVLGCPKLCRAS